MNVFLSGVKTAFETFSRLTSSCQRGQRIQVVLGNESCDLDSCVSTLVLSWSRAKVEANVLYVPVMNVARDLFHTRTEIMYVLNELQIEPKHIFCLDEINLLELSQLEKEFFKLTLVDHHMLAKCNQYLAPFVVEIIDHRTPLKEFSSSVICNIATVGSCSTLIAEEMLKSVDSCEILNDIEVVLIAAILLDTNNLSVAAGRVTSRDTKVINCLKRDRNDKDLSTLFDKVSSAKFSVEGLTTKNILLKDAKWIENSVQRIMFSTLHQEMNEFFQRPDAQEVIETYCNINNLCAWVALAPRVNGYKPIAVYSDDKLMKEEIITKLVSATSLEIQSCDEDFHFINFHLLRMYNCKNTRKQVLPVVHQLLQETD